MKMKQIPAGDMKEAMRRARDELGDDAVLLDSKKVAGGGLIVTFAVDESEPVAFDDIPMERPEPYVARNLSPRADSDHPAYAIAADAIAYNEVPEPLRIKLLRRLKGANFAAGALNDVAERALADCLGSELQYAAIATSQSLPPARAIMLVGMHGAGKTSALAKLATELTLHKKRVVIVSADNERMGAADTLAGLCALLKCDFHMAEDRAALKPVLKNYIGNAFVLIDSTGVNFYEFQQLKALGELAGLNDVEPILTCPAGMDAHEAEEMARVLSFLGIDRMIATKVDATRRLNSVFAALVAGGLALANISSSAKPTHACSAASPATLARLMLRHVRERTA